MAPATAVAMAKPPDRRGAVLAAIALGAALGGPARYGVDQLWPSAAGGFPWATLLINVSGSLALGLFLAVLVGRFPPSLFLRPFVATGFLGSYTTFSTFCVEADRLVEGGHPATAVAYVAASVLLGLLAAWLGVRVGHALPAHPRREPQR